MPGSTCPNRARLLRATLLLALHGAGCASLVSGNRQQVRLLTSPGDATAYVDGVPTYGGARALDLLRGRPHAIRVEREGYNGRTYDLERKMNPWVWGNLALGPLFFIGVLVDVVTGAVTELSPGEIWVSLPPGPDHAPAPEVPAPIEAAAASADPPEEQLEWIVAVMEVSATGQAGPEPELRSALTEQLRVYLATHRVRVVDRGAQEAALAQLLAEEKRRSYDPCVDAACQVPLGKALAATHLLRTGIARFGSTCATNGELIELKTEVAVAAASTRSDCSEEGFLDAASRLADQLLAPRFAATSRERVNSDRLLDPRPGER